MLTVPHKAGMTCPPPQCPIHNIYKCILTYLHASSSLSLGGLLWDVWGQHPDNESCEFVGKQMPGWTWIKSDYRCRSGRKMVQSFLRQCVEILIFPS